MRYTLAALVTMMPLAAHASPICSEPQPPYCLDSYYTFEDQSSFDACQNDMESYQSEVDRYLRCVSDWADDQVAEANDLQEDAISEFQEAVDRFECKARDPGGIC